MGELGLQALRDEEGLLLDVPLMTLSRGSLNWTVFAVFFKLLWGKNCREGKCNVASLSQLGGPRK